MPSRRRLARISAMQTVFESQSRSIDTDESLLKNVAELGGKDAVDSKFAAELVTGVRSEWEALCAAVQEHAPEWPLDRMDIITRSILMIGAFEILKGKDAPPAVVMNEAIEIAKEYGPEESPKFVNGVLNALAHRKG